MSLNRFIAIFESAVEGIESNTLSAQTRYKELKAWDSLAVLTLTDAVEMEYGFLLNRKHFESAQTLEDIYRCIQRSGSVG